ncbi:MAG TPA: hypothetical protein PKD63_04630 [Solirubrobacteraceae bacterium]|nr:hypothetical protein [Solirubrobacteraceae bacterium]
MRPGLASLLLAALFATATTTAFAALPVTGARENITNTRGLFVGPFETDFAAAGAAGVRMRTSREADSATLLLPAGTTIVQVILEVQCAGRPGAAVASAQRAYRVRKSRRGDHRLRPTTVTASCAEGQRLGGDAFSGPARGWLCLRRVSGTPFAGVEFGGLQTCRRYPAP